LTCVQIKSTKFGASSVAGQMRENGRLIITTQPIGIYEN